MLLYLVVEIVALVALVSWIGVGWTLLVLLAGSVLGLWLARREGLRALRAMSEAARERRVVHVEVTDGLLIAVGGLLLIVPGLVTDVAGLLLLLPPTRGLVRRRMVRDAERQVPLLRTARLRADGTVVDGEVLAWDEAAERPLPFAALQQRIGRKTLNAKVLRDAPAVLIAYDLLECDGVDWRERPQSERRARLEALLGQAVQTPCAGAADNAGEARVSPRLKLSTLVEAADWEGYARLREQSRERGVEGFMLKRRDARYGIGRTKAEGIGEWWKWKIDPYTVDAVLIYAQPGSGKRASLHTDYTFAVWSDAPGTERVLVPFAKAYSGLTDAEIRQVDAIVRRTTLEKFGPVRSVRPEQVFELGFEGIQRSTRHKSGIAVRFPRILRWRHDKPADEADTLQTLQALIGPSV